MPFAPFVASLLLVVRPRAPSSFYVLYTAVYRQLYNYITITVTCIDKTLRKWPGPRHITGIMGR